MNLQHVEEEENLDVKEEDDDEHIERVSFVNLDSRRKWANTPLKKKI